MINQVERFVLLNIINTDFMKNYENDKRIILKELVKKHDPRYIEITTGMSINYIKKNSLTKDEFKELMQFYLDDKSNNYIFNHNKEFIC